jgi:hypothetical protein
MHVVFSNPGDLWEERMQVHLKLAIAAEQGIPICFVIAEVLKSLNVYSSCSCPADLSSRSPRPASVGVAVAWRNAERELAMAGARSTGWRRARTRSYWAPPRHRTAAKVRRRPEARRGRRGRGRGRWDRVLLAVRRERQRGMLDEADDIVAGNGTRSSFLSSRDIILPPSYETCHTSKF